MWLRRSFVVTLEVWDVFLGLVVLDWFEAFKSTVASDEIVEFDFSAVILSVFGSYSPWALIVLSC